VYPDSKSGEYLLVFDSDIADKKGDKKKGTALAAFLSQRVTPLVTVFGYDVPSVVKVCLQVIERLYVTFCCT
jgi:hypothetical protein